MSTVADLRKFFAALAGINDSGPAALEQLHTALERIPLIHQHPKEITMTALAKVLTPPLADPTRGTRRTAPPRLVVRNTGGVLVHTIPASDARNLTGRRAGLWCTDWEIVLVEEDGAELLLECHTTGASAIASLPFLLRQVGLLWADGTRRAPEGGASDAA